MTRILIADDNPVVRECLRRLLSAHAGWELCGEASNGEDTLRLAQELKPDVIVLDFRMPGKNGVEIAREIGALLPGTPILLCSVFLTPQLIALARAAGIAGTLSKGDLNKVIPCVEVLLRGDTFFLSDRPQGAYQAPAAPSAHRPSILPTRINR
jgi:DNA-binding NarL/FixJ family response regulator